MTKNKIDTRDIKGITLLSLDEAESLPEDIRAIDKWYWLRSPGFNCYNAALIYFDGSVFDYGNLVYCDFGAVRPALKISNLKSYDFEDYSKVRLFDKDWFVLNNLNYLLLAPGDLGNHRFDEKSNNYETSEIKKFLENWLQEMLEIFPPVSLRRTQRDRLNAMSNEEFYDFIVGAELEYLKFRSTSFRDDFLVWLDSDVESSRILKLVEHTPDGDVLYYFDGYIEHIPYANQMPICEAEIEKPMIYRDINEVIDSAE